MTDNMKKFLEMLSQNEDLKNKISTMTETSDVIVAARGFGIELTETDFEVPDGEMNERELSDVTGGGRCICTMYGGGGGTDARDDKTYGCACFVYGQGGDGRADDANCFCIQAGGGDDTTQYVF